ncbi:hypothetical protein P3H15_09860 [Rhodococcus sp. T2V]|uniref:hypothetical protein n=1 Tax=Rhodococcus sp. T2V TaxID=3034164 RepID=UPI0023E23A0B|nr:hypothetical protein [Rhodococcus sp. T2V]MDF3305325.1 hypothetical protein [Rhodococcus sp. T2V]
MITLGGTDPRTGTTVAETAGIRGAAAGAASCFERASRGFRVALPYPIGSELEAIPRRVDGTPMVSDWL